MDWNDLRYFLEVSRAGTTLGASRKLRVSQSTVARRIAALEEALGVQLFEKLQSGYVLTDAGSALLPSAEQAETSIKGFAATAEANRRELSGVVKLATNETFAAHFLMQALKEFRNTYPKVRLEVVTGDRFHDLGKGEADIAVRAGNRPDQNELVGKRVATDIWSLYCSRDYAAAHGVPANESELKGHSFITIDPAVFSGPTMDWVAAHIPDDAVVLRQNSIAGLVTGIQSGFGISLMSDFLFEGRSDVVKCFTPEISEPAEVWLVTHERLRHLPRIRAVMDFMSGYFATGRHKLVSTTT